MHIKRVELYQIELPLVHPFETSFGRESTRTCILVAVHTDDLIGWGECVAMSGPWYSSETVETAWHVLSDFLVPLALGQTVDEPTDVSGWFARVRGHQMARAALENAIWDLAAQVRGVSLTQLLGGTRTEVPVGVSIGIEPTVDALMNIVTQYVDEGYQRVKLKIKPAWDVAVVRAVRERWPDLLLQVDANSAYTLDDVAILRELDQFGLLLIEQPLHHDDIVDHATLQTQLQTPICLDESIHSPDHARWALEIGACRIINIKVGRVGGLSAALQIHDLCAAHQVPVWCGGMLETNIGRAVNVVLATLPNFILPGDISASARYYQQDVAEPDFVLSANSTVAVPQGTGIGVTVDRERLAAVQTRYVSFSK
ncbi:MAG: o-succinylbenzoate synthase [Chloroflexi bacterium AL-W]|nr:o-succinylbenzoate synthase [Chloroflexi bacterium AL-N1]NOK65643.1 o-succinylbenzoate synthase [Chloroflexi bacterium AL-N10]NOK74416.1 o-succinylbenzoate synthase [Chloroflexi bacterium AL-N5]NOK80676.1 o-succinylbenzoate synthase [Chloroflexi bacterium AL-W]NOK88674.1 o-succinylbenzoate synthase [Chloroflexi bacterium AL-N15]